MTTINLLSILPIDLIYELTRKLDIDEIENLSGFLPGGSLQDFVSHYISLEEYLTSEKFWKLWTIQNLFPHHNPELIEQSNDPRKWYHYAKTRSPPTGNTVYTISESNKNVCNIVPVHVDMVNSISSICEYHGYIIGIKNGNIVHMKSIISSNPEVVSDRSYKDQSITHSDEKFVFPKHELNDPYVRCWTSNNDMIIFALTKNGKLFLGNNNYNPMLGNGDRINPKDTTPIYLKFLDNLVVIDASIHISHNTLRNYLVINDNRGNVYLIDQLIYDFYQPDEPKPIEWFEPFLLDIPDAIVRIKMNDTSQIKNIDSDLQLGPTTLRLISSTGKMYWKSISRSAGGFVAYDLSELKSSQGLSSLYPEVEVIEVLGRYIVDTDFYGNFGDTDLILTAPFEGNNVYSRFDRDNSIFEETSGKYSYQPDIVKISVGKKYISYVTNTHQLYIKEDRYYNISADKFYVRKYTKCNLMDIGSHGHNIKETSIVDTVSSKTNNVKLYALGRTFV